MSKGKRSTRRGPSFESLPSRTSLREPQDLTTEFNDRVERSVLILYFRIRFTLYLIPCTLFYHLMTPYPHQSFRASELQSLRASEPPSFRASQPPGFQAFLLFLLNQPNNNLFFFYYFYYNFACIYFSNLILSNQLFHESIQKFLRLNLLDGLFCLSWL